MSLISAQESHPLLDHARNEMIRAGLFDKDSDYEGLIARSVMDMLKAHIKAGHSGASHEQVLEIFNILVRYKPLTPITSDPSEWNDVSDVSGKPLWQSNRNFACFSTDGGKTWYSLDDKGKK